MELKKIDVVWSDKKRWCGFPVTFTNYSLSNDRLFVRKGLITQSQNETLLYRVKDITFKRGLWQRICGVGTIILNTNDTSTPVIIIRNIKDVEAVKELLHEKTEAAKAAKGIYVGEVYY